MIEDNYNLQTGQGYLRLSPNISMSWQGNKRFLLAAATLMLLVASRFAWLGFWVIVPFTLAELSLLGFCIYRVHQKLSLSEVLIFTDTQVILQKGRYQCTESHPFSRYWASFLVVNEGYGHGPKLYLKMHQQQLELAYLLNPREKRQLINKLKTITHNHNSLVNHMHE